METFTSLCGIYNCGECNHRMSDDCVGCGAGNVLLKEKDAGVCSVYACVLSRGLGSCNDCKEMSCALKRSVEMICPLRSRFENKRWWAGRMSRALEARKQSRDNAEREGKMSEKVVSRLRWYLTALDLFAAEGVASVSSWQLAERVGVNSALIRKDLSRVGEFGTPSFGYRTDFLREQIEHILHLDKPKAIAWIGAGCFRHQSTSIERLASHGCNVVVLFDPDPSEIGGSACGQMVYPVEDLSNYFLNNDVQAAVIAISGPKAQETADMLADLGVKAILNLGGEMLVLPERVKLCNIDVVGELMELCYYCG